MKNEEVIKAFLNRKEAKSYTGSLWCNEYKLFSYHTCIAEFNKDDELYLNLSKYTRTTTRHQQLLVANLKNKINNKIVYDIPKNKTYIVPKEEQIYK